MINTVSDLINEYVSRQKVDLKKYDKLGHPGMIGDIYEGLSKKLLDSAIFQGLDLRVVDGKVRNDKGDLSKQIDGMIVIGEGEQIPHTKHYIYDFQSVVAVCESKKSLYSKDISDSYENILEFNNTFYPADSKFKKSDVERAFRLLTRKNLKSPLSANSERDQFMYHVLVIMFSYPVRIVIGYDGFAKHTNFRSAFSSYLHESVGRKGFGVNSFPDLVICGQYALVKSNFQPFGSEMDETGFFPILASGTKNPFYYFLALLWAKLQITFNLSSEFWGEDDDLEVVIPFLSARVNDTLLGWDYHVSEFDEANLAGPHPEMPYEPYYVSEKVLSISEALCHNSTLNLIEFGIPTELIEDVLRELKSCKYFEVEGNEVSLVTEVLNCAILPTGESVVGENSDGAFSAG